MTKEEAIKLFGKVRATADALEITTQAVYNWPDELPMSVGDRVLGAAARKGLLDKVKDRDRMTAVDPKKVDGDQIYLVKIVGKE